GRYYKTRREKRKPRGRELRADNRYCIRTDGLAAYRRRVKMRFIPKAKSYGEYFLEHRPSAEEMERQRRRSFDYVPLISIAVPLYNTPAQYLKDMVESVLGQTYSNWELCLADGSTDDSVEHYMKQHYGAEKRIRYRRLADNQGISGNTNEALSMASGEYVMLADHDDMLERDALYEMVSVLNEDRGTDIIYTDEDLVDAGGTEFSNPRYKPDYNPDFLCSINYICHIFMVRRSILDRAGGFRGEFDGAQDYDLILRCCEQTQKIRHIPKVLYHWRAHPDSTAGNPESKMYAVEAGKKALQEHYQRMGIDAEIEYTGIFIMFRTILKVKDEPKVSVLIPNKDHIGDLDKCISSVVEKTIYQNYEIIVIENNSEEEETFAYYRRLQEKNSRARVVTWEHEFNYSKINNFGASFADGEYYLLLNNDIEVISPTWMSDMLGYCQREDVGAVGAKLYFEDDTVQHAGIVLGVGGFAGHILTGESSGDVGYFGRLKAIQDISAVTAACLMIRRSVFEEIGGFDESFSVALNDVDLCLKVRATGRLIVFQPWAELYHYESKSRGYEDSPEKIERFKSEIRRFREKWKDVLEQGDPYYNVNLILDRGDCSIRREDERFEIIEEIEREQRTQQSGHVVL
ncbi:MAG: glycosyltransferase, partial [Lachnospiraceae bacterium]|nr:glycosyltransferase [Lachnospiraceae bacterium]